VQQVDLSLYDTSLFMYQSQYIVIFTVAQGRLLYSPILLDCSSECGPSSGHCTRTWKCIQKLVCPVTLEISPFHIKSMLKMYV